MCTVSWLRRDGGGFELFCNRDERRTRAAALAPTLGARGPVRYVAPADGDFGGTWIAANEHGLALCLLNNYEPARAKRHAGERSRGLLLTDLIDCRASSSVRARLAAPPALLRYRPFTLLALDTGGACFAARWSKGRLTFDDDPRAPLTSSSFETAAVRASREELFRRAVRDACGARAELLEEFHRGHEPARGPFSVCMHRADAATVSFSRVSVREELVEFEYRPGAPCEGGAPTRVTLQRAKADAGMGART